MKSPESLQVMTGKENLIKKLKESSPENLIRGISMGLSYSSSRVFSGEIYRGL